MPFTPMRMLRKIFRDPELVAIREALDLSERMLKSKSHVTVIGAGYYELLRLDVEGDLYVSPLAHGVYISNCIFEGRINLDDAKPQTDWRAVDPFQHQNS